VSAFDDDVGRREVHLRCAHRLDSDEADINAAGGERFEHLAGDRERHVVERHAQPLGQRGSQFGRDAARLAVRALLRQHAVAEIDRRAQLAGRRQVLQHRGRRRGLREGGPCGGEHHGSADK